MFYCPTCGTHKEIYDNPQEYQKSRDALLKACEGVLDFIEYRIEDLVHLGETQIHKDKLRKAIERAKGPEHGKRTSV